jgi:hypothetical protein
LLHYYGFFNDDTHRSILLQFDECFATGVYTFQNSHFWSAAFLVFQVQRTSPKGLQVRGLMSLRIIFLCRSGRWTTTGPAGGKKSEADNSPNCPEDATNWDDGASHPRRVFCGKVFNLLSGQRTKDKCVMLNQRKLRGDLPRKN